MKYNDGLITCSELNIGQKLFGHSRTLSRLSRSLQLLQENFFAPKARKKLILAFKTGCARRNRHFVFTFFTPYIPNQPTRQRNQLRDAPVSTALVLNVKFQNFSRLLRDSEIPFTFGCSVAKKCVIFKIYVLKLHFFRCRKTQNSGL